MEEQVYEVGEIDTNRHLAVLICAQTGGAEIERFSTSFVTLSTGNGTARGEYKLVHICTVRSKLIFISISREGIHSQQNFVLPAQELVKCFITNHPLRPQPRSIYYSQVAK